MKSNPLQICDVTIHPGEKISLAFPTPEFYTCAPMHIPIHVLHGKKSGPILVICAAIHGDQTNGVEIIRRLLNLKALNGLAGTLIAVPVVNIYGLMTRSRNLPDGRDLEGSFPGQEMGSYASRLAYFFNKKILQLADVCIDIHSADLHIDKLPHVQTDLSHSKANALAKIFNAPIIHNTLETRSLLFLMKGDEKKIPTLLFEGGEALRLDEDVIKIGMRGIINVMKDLKMLKTSPKIKFKDVAIVDELQWIFSPGSGICNFYKKIGSYVNEKELVAKVADPFGTKQTFDIYSPLTGIITSVKKSPLISEGEPIMEIAKHLEPKSISEQITTLHQTNE